MSTQSELFEPVDQNVEDDNSEAENSDDCLKIDVDSPQSKKKFKSKPLEMNDDDKEIIKSVESELEEILEEKAARTNLTSCDVKKILKHVCTNEHVIAMVRHVEDPEISSMLTVYEPKLTRAKAKELFSSHSTPIPWISTPKPPSEVQVLISEELQEDSSGDEYVPAEEESEDDRDSAVLSESSPSSLGPPTPKNTDFATQTNWSEDGVFKIPLIKMRQETDEEANISRRTRSKLSLSSTPLEVIEEAFIPPDITTDMYDMDCDDDEWKDFLKKFTRPLDEVTKCEDEDHDPEYNILADEEIDKVDKEELRADKGVKVSRKELNELIAELFEYADNFTTQNQNTTVLDPQPQYTVLEPENVNLSENNVTETFQVIDVKAEECLMIKEDQKLLLQQQMRQHVQMLSQNFLLTYDHPEYSDLAAKCKEYLNNLKLLPGNRANSYFQTCNLDSAVKLVEFWEMKYESNDAEVQKTKEYVYKVISEVQQRKATGNQYIPTFPRLILETISNSDVFLYPHLLPRIPFKPSSTVNNRGFLSSENDLLALGLEQFVPFLQEDKSYVSSKGNVTLKQVCYFIHKYMMPVKDALKLYKYVCDCKYLKCDPNAVTYYFEHKRAPPTTHFVVSLSEFGVLPPCRRETEALPHQWKQFIYPPVQNIPSFVAISLLPPSITKVVKPPVYNKSFTSKRKILPKASATRKPKRKLKIHQKDSAVHDDNPIIGGVHASSPTRKITKLEHYFDSPVISKKPLHILAGNLSGLKFNSDIFKELPRETEVKVMLPSMPCLSTPYKKEPERDDGPDNSAKVNLIDSEVNVTNIEATVELDDEDPPKDNLEDINALMVASSTITTVNKRKLSGAEKKKAKLKKDFSASLSVLTPEGRNVMEEKTNLYVQAFYDKLQERLDIHDYHRLMEILNGFDEDKDSVSALYKDVNEILNPKYPDLTDEFLTFLTAAQAKAVGKLIPHLMLTNMSLFLRKLEMYFKDQPSQVRKIYRSLSELAECANVTMDKIKTSIIPLLKGNALLTDWFLQIFPCEKPPNSLLNGTWDHVEVGKEGAVNENRCETITVPKVEDPYGGPNCTCCCHNVEEQAFKNRSSHCVPCGTKFFQGRVYVQTGKGLRLAKVTFNDSPNVDHYARLGCKSTVQKRKTESNSSKLVTSPNKDNQDEVRMSNESEEETECARKKHQKLVKKPRIRKPRRKVEKTNKEKTATARQIDNSSLLQSGTSKLVVINPEAGDSRKSIKPEMTCESAQQKLNEDVAEWDCNTSVESMELKLSPEISTGSASEETSQDNINSESDVSSDATNSPNHSDGNSNSEGVSWTREEDKVILETFQKEGDKEETFLHISKLLENRSVANIKCRFQTLMKLLREMASNTS